MMVTGNRKGLNLTQSIGSGANEKEYTSIGNQFTKFRSCSFEVKRDAISQRNNSTARNETSFRG